jgi:DNA-binding transcriptional ArsR family regulator
LIDLPGSEEDTYSTIFASLKHPIRRRILRILFDGPQSFTDLQRSFNIESSHLTYHLEGLGSLLVKTEDGKYALSSLGEASVSTMKHVEEPPKNSRRLGMRSTRPILRNLLTILLVCALIASLVFNAVFLLKYTELSNPNNEKKEALLLWYDLCGTGRSQFGTSMYGIGLERVSIPESFNMSTPTTFFTHYFGIHLNSSTRAVFRFQATAPINFQLALDARNINWETHARPQLAEALAVGQIVINETQTTSLTSEFLVHDPGLYVFVFEPVESSPASTVTFNAHLN